MRILVYGAGAVGGYFGALLARGGLDVWFVARGENLAVLRTRGLEVDLGTETLHLPTVHAVAEPREAPPPDLVLVCVKSYDTAAAATALRPIIGADTSVLSLQNGIENEDILARGLGVGPLMVALTRIGVALVAPGKIAYSGRGTIVYGEPDG
ncbi:MAG TPA: 2-dehydropantoate 2-reductase N-terminal domain-containing protein, partial [Candidatus Binatia bacterium]|nr:2-dehydropantoate 2-reductase N-terminal domain-containing protein [Candidatus Binatia bacterium]